MQINIGPYKKNRKIKIKIDKWDTWSMDHTLAMIVHPMLKQLKKTKHGAPFVDDEDVPEDLKSTAAPPKENEWDTDANHFKRWDYVLDEMIWAFKQLKRDDEKSFWIVEPELDLDNYPEDEGKDIIPVRWKVEGEMDQEAYNAYWQRINTGTKMFGKYYRSLWD